LQNDKGDVFNLQPTEIDANNYIGNSFDKGFVKRASYSYFLQEMDSNHLLVFREANSTFTQKMTEMISKPEFYDPIAKFEYLEVTQG
jgi:hypothetical protein